MSAVGARLVVAALVVALALCGTARADGGGVALSVDRSNVSTELGRRFEFRTTVTSTGTAPSQSLIAHLNVLSLERGVYVDPEDWSSDRTRYLGTLQGGASRTLTWNIHAVNDGRFAAYITVVAQDMAAESTPTTSAVVEFDVERRTTLNSGGILPLAFGVPGLLVLLTIGARVVRHRSPRPR